MRALLSIVAGVALAVAGTVAIAGSGYTPPASSGGGVEGDGTGVTDASAFRSALSLGTAATVNTGTSAGNVVVLNSSAQLPAVDGSLLTGLTSTQLSGLAYAAETWTDRWKTSDGSPTSNGWSQAGTQTMTIASTTQGGVACYSLTPNAV